MTAPTESEAASRPATDPLALALAPAAAIAIGGVPFVTVGLYRVGFDVPSALFWRALFSFAVIAVAAMVMRTPVTTAWRNGGGRVFALALTIGTLQTFCYFQAISRLPTSVVILLFFLYPLVTIVLQRVVFGVRAAPLAIAAGVLILIGAGLTGSGTLRLEGVRLTDVAIALVPPFTYAAYAIALVRVGGGLPVVAGAGMIQLGTLVGFMLLALPGGLVVPWNVDGWARVAAVGVLGSAFHVLVLAYSLPRLGPTLYAIVSSLELVTVVVLGVLLLGETLSVAQWLGVVLVLVGILLYRPARGGRPAE